MAILAGARPTPRLLALFLFATLLPGGALGWFGWQLLNQDVRLERQRIQDLLESTADRVSAVIDREVSARERHLGSSTAAAPDDTGLPFTMMVRVDRNGRAITLGGRPLLYDLGRPAFPADGTRSIWTDVERLEFGAGDLKAAADAYRRLSRSTDRQTRAGSLVRLARVLRSAGRPDAALDVYTELATGPDATILGDPADLVARWARVELLASLAREKEARVEAAALDVDLRRARWLLTRTSALAYAGALRPWRSNADEGQWATETGLNDAVFALWQEWNSTPNGTFGTGRRAFSEGSEDQLVLWRDEGDTLVIHAAAVAQLIRSWQHLWATPDLAVALMDPKGRIVAGDAPTANGAAAIRTAAETRLPWAVRVAATRTPGEILSTGLSRRRIIVATLILIGFLIPATGYLVWRAVHRELMLARQQAEFVAAVSHEFRSPLTALSHLTELLRSDFQPSDERRRQYYDTLAQETDRLRRFVETLLDVRRIQAGATRYDPTNVDVQRLVATVVDDFRQHAIAGKHRVTFTAPDAAFYARVDADALHRALWNLLENAAKYSQSGSPIAVVIDRENERVAIRVADEGPGIPPSEQPFVFDQFFRGAAAAQSAIRGTGIGLALVRHMTEAHGGEVRLDSRVGVGSSFTIVLPIASGPAVNRETRRVS